MAAVFTIDLNDRVRAGNNRIEGLTASGLKFEFGKITGDGGAYTTGGDDWAPSTMDKSRVLLSIFECGVTGYGAHYEQSSGKLSIWDGATQHAASACSLVFDYLIVGY